MKKFLCGILMLALLLSGCQGLDRASKEGKTREIFAMDTVMTLTCYGEKAEEALDAAEAEIRRLDKLLSIGDPKSEISQLNAAGTLEASEDVCTMIREAKLINERSHGALDLSVFPLVNLWGFPQQKLHIPTEEELTQALETVGMQLVTITDHTVTVGEGQQLDLGAIAKGYTSDRLMKIFNEYELEAAIVSLGGNVQCYKTKVDGTRWRVGVTDPSNPGGSDYLGILDLEDQAAVTSGAYERYLEDEATGEKYHHILDPKTGRPADSGVISSTIVSKNGMLADALSTATFVMGVERATAYWQEYGKDFDMILVDQDGTIYVTEPLSEHFSSEQKFEIIK